MDSSKFLILGANGQLGKALQNKYPNARKADRQVLDISSKASVNDYDWSGVTHILNAASYTLVDAAETPEGRYTAWAVNSQGVANLSQVASQKNITLVHISTDYVFDGTKEPHSEDEGFSPLSVYGASKAAGDIAASLTPKHYIIRVSWVIGEGKNFVRSIAGLADRDISPRVVHDQTGRLTFTSEIVKAIDHLINNSSEHGTYNLSNGGDISSWADIAREIYRALGRNDLEVSNTTAEEYFKNQPVVAARPHKSALDLKKIQSIDFEPTDWKTDLANYLEGAKK